VDKAIKSRRLYTRASLAPLLAFAMLFWTGTPASGQTASTPDRQTMPPQAMPPEQTMPPQHEGDNDTTRRELAEMDRFLDGHPEVAEQLRKDPSLINNQEFVEKHPELREFLQNHPGVREEFRENPNAFMRQENRYERHEGDDRDRDRDRDRRDGDTTRRELASMDRFMDGHPEIAEQLRKDPSLINNREFVENHPALQQYLQSHPEVREEFKENPSAFMRQENRYERHEGDDRDRGRRDGDTTRRELASMDRFMDGHPEIAEQLRKDPSLVKNREFVENHPALQEYLQSHPEVREEFKENPNAFMRQENRYDRREDDRDRGHGISTGDRKDRNRMGNPDGRGELTSFGQFLGGHSTVAEQLSKDPSLANNKEYLANHPELGEYLKAHPAVTQQLSENPQAVMSSNWVMQSSSTAGKTTPPKGKPNQ
jgi:YHS domain-containing protein